MIKILTIYSCVWFIFGLLSVFLLGKIDKSSEKSRSDKYEILAIFLLGLGSFFILFFCALYAVLHTVYLKLYRNKLSSFLVFIYNKGYGK